MTVVSLVAGADEAVRRTLMFQPKAVRQPCSPAQSHFAAIWRIDSIQKPKNE